MSEDQQDLDVDLLKENAMRRANQCQKLSIEIINLLITSGETVEMQVLATVTSNILLACSNPEEALSKYKEILDKSLEFVKKIKDDHEKQAS